MKLIIDKHPLIKAIEMKKHALRNKLHPLLIIQIDKTINKRAKDSAAILMKSKFCREILGE